MAHTIERVTGNALRAVMGEVARLRIEVFREFPYLYAGTAAYEEEYLGEYAQAPGAVVVVAREGDAVVGASTGMPLSAADVAFRKPLVAAGEDVSQWFYFGESVLMPSMRGRGIGHQFFDHREAHARDLGYARLAFCAVVRPPDHPLRPATYRPLDEFWFKRGFAKRPEWVARLRWRQIDSGNQEVENELAFWTKETVE